MDILPRTEGERDTQAGSGINFFSVLDLSVKAYDWEPILWNVGEEPILSKNAVIEEEEIRWNDLAPLTSVTGLSLYRVKLAADSVKLNLVTYPVMSM